MASPPKARLSDLAFVEVPDRAAWRAWLLKHHATSPGIWLAVGKKGNTVTALSYDGAVEEALCFGWIDSTVHRLDESRYRQLYTPRKKGGNWAASNKARVERLIAEGLMTPAGLAAIEAAKADGSWNNLDDAEAMVVPADLADALADDPDAAARFESLAPSMRKQVIWWIASAKRAETRAKRVAETVAAAAEGRAPRG